MDTPQPAAELHVDEALARSLVALQYPTLAGEAVRFHDEGWDNVTFRLGAGHAVRLPRRATAADLLRNEQEWLPELAERLEVDVPVPVHRGTPDAGYPWPWSIVPWIPGTPADEDPPGPGQGAWLGRNLRALHQPAGSEVPRNPFRGLPLVERHDFVAQRFDGLAKSGVDVVPLESAWRQGVEASVATEDLWLHGDLHPRNVIVRQGRIAGIIDWGDLCRGDPATDLAVCWTLLPPGDRSAFWSAYGADDDALRQRSRAWAVFFGVALATTDEERHRRMGVGIVDALCSAARGERT